MPDLSASDALDVLGSQLVGLMVGGCTCMTKTPEVAAHEAGCVYRRASEASLVLKALETALDRDFGVRSSRSVEPARSLVEAAARAIHDHWQNAPGPHARTWADTIEKLPAAAEDFRRMGAAVAKAVLPWSRGVPVPYGHLVERVAEAVHDSWNPVRVRGADGWTATCVERPRVAEDYRAKARLAMDAVVAAASGLAPGPVDGMHAVVRRKDDGKGYLCRWGADGTTWLDGVLERTGAWFAVVAGGWFQPDEIDGYEPLGSRAEVEDRIAEEVGREVKERVDARLVAMTARRDDVPPAGRDGRGKPGPHPVRRSFSTVRRIVDGKRMLCGWQSGDDGRPEGWVRYGTNTAIPADEVDEVEAVEDEDELDRLIEDEVTRVVNERMMEKSFGVAGHDAPAARSE